MSKTDYKAIYKLLAWSVHVFTASGLLMGLLAMLAANQADYRLAMFYLIIAGLIDGIDGTFARLLEVKKVLPYMNGSMIDVVVDFVNYALVPAYIIYQSKILPEGMDFFIAGLILLTSALYYGKEGMIYQEKFFIGFPVLWNVIAFYLLFVLNWEAIYNVVFIVVFAVLHFVPLKYSYPSRRSRFQKLDLLMSLVLLITMIYTLYIFPESNIVSRFAAIGTGIYFMIMALYNTYIDEKV